MTANFLASLLSRDKESGLLVDAIDLAIKRNEFAKNSTVTPKKTGRATICARATVFYARKHLSDSELLKELIPTASSDGSELGEPENADSFRLLVDAIKLESSQRDSLLRFTNLQILMKRMIAEYAQEFFPETLTQLHINPAEIDIFESKRSGRKGTSPELG